jgi:hypothetical protein
LNKQDKGEKTIIFLFLLVLSALWGTKIKEKKPFISCSFWSYPPYGEQKWIREKIWLNELRAVR